MAVPPAAGHSSRAGDLVLGLLDLLVLDWVMPLDEVRIERNQASPRDGEAFSEMEVVLRHHDPLHHLRSRVVDILQLDLEEHQDAESNQIPAFLGVGS